MKNKPWFDERGWMLRSLPRACVAECSASGPVDSAVTYWRKKLAFTVPERCARAWLKEFGAWDAEELAALDAEELAEKCLWLLACDVNENGRTFGLV